MQLAQMTRSKTPSKAGCAVMLTAWVWSRSAQSLVRLVHELALSFSMVYYYSMNQVGVTAGAVGRKRVERTATAGTSELRNGSHARVVSAFD